MSILFPYPSQCCPYCISVPLKQAMKLTLLFYGTIVKKLVCLLHPSENVRCHLSHITIVTMHLMVISSQRIALIKS